MRSAIIGYGSIGARHAKNIKGLGHEVFIIDVEPKALEKARSDEYICYNTIDEVLKNKIDFAVICSPTQYHIQNAMSFATEGIHVFVEKPLSYNMDGVDTLLNVCKEQNVKLMCGCNLCFLNGTKLIKTLLQNNTIGKVYATNYFYGNCLKNWHPGTDYTKSYSAGLYGGALLEDIHAIDLMLYLFNKITNIKGYLLHTRTLKITKEEIADYILTCEDFFYNKIVCHIHSDLLLPEYQRTLEVWGYGGMIQYDMYEGIVSLKTPTIEEWRTFNVKEETNQMYLSEIQYFIDCIAKNIEPMTDGVVPLKWVLELKRQNGEL